MATASKIVFPDTPQYWLGWSNSGRMARTGRLSVSLMCYSIYWAMLSAYNALVYEASFSGCRLWLLTLWHLPVLVHLNKQCSHITGFLPKVLKRTPVLHRLYRAIFSLCRLNTGAISSSVVIGISSVSFQPPSTHPYPVNNIILTLSSSICIGRHLFRMCSLNTRNISLADICHPWCRSCTSEFSRCLLLCLRLIKRNRDMSSWWNMPCVRS